MDLRLIERRMTLQIAAMNVRAPPEKNLDHGSLIAMGGGMKRRGSPVLVQVLRLDVRPSVEQEVDQSRVPFPRGPMERRGLLSFTRVDLLGTLCQDPANL